MSDDRELKAVCRAFENNGNIPREYTGFGRDISPGFELKNLCENAVSVAVIMDDLDIPFIPAYNHWLIWNLPAMAVIPENIPCGAVVKELGNAVQGRGYGKNRYRGPKQPVFVRNTHRYVFRFYALDCLLPLDGTAGKKELLKAMEGHVLQKGELCERYKRGM